MFFSSISSQKCAHQRSHQRTHANNDTNSTNFTHNQIHNRGITQKNPGQKGSGTSCRAMPSVERQQHPCARTCFASLREKCLATVTRVPELDNPPHPDSYKYKKSFPSEAKNSKKKSWKQLTKQPRRQIPTELVLCSVSAGRQSSTTLECTAVPDDGQSCRLLASETTRSITTASHATITRLANLWYRSTRPLNAWPVSRLHFTPPLPKRMDISWPVRKNRVTTNTLLLQDFNEHNEAPPCRTDVPFETPHARQK